MVAATTGDRPHVNGEKGVENGDKFANSDKPAVELLVPIPASTLRRFQKAGIDLSGGYPLLPADFDYLAGADAAEIVYHQDAVAHAEKVHPYEDAALRADPQKRALFAAAKEVVDLTSHIGTEIVGVQLKDLTDQQKDELALLVAERGVVFFRDQDLSPQQQEGLGRYWGELYPQGPFVPGHPDISTIWTDFFATKFRKPSYRQPFQGFHTDMVHERHPPGYTHLHKDAVPTVGGDLLWASGYAAYSKLSPDFRKMIDGKKAVFISREKYMDKNNPSQGPVHCISRVHPLVRTHPVTGWKTLYVAHGWVSHIVGLDKKESDLILNYLIDIYENNVDTQCRWKWTAGSSAIWDNRCTLHTASWDYENASERHGTRVTTLAEEPFFDENSITRRQALGLADE
ncbi:alpha-ketoglutarate-dependent taurine dioxygenase [Xylariaceae sp. FL1019]|nr:alpha-ketoglutarate-dependent taurine dioxygenase [Xylariaceae sp. FL1019]